ncbi:L-lactate dehydrogenase (cytochrome), partial [Phenoliferia sp. Uapishka_3]
MFRPVPGIARAATRSSRYAPQGRLLSSSARKVSPVAPWITAAAGLSILGLVSVYSHQEVALDSALPDKLGRVVYAEEVREHNTKEDAWVVIDGKVYDISEFLEMHPGGEDVVIKHLGKNISPIFNLLHAKGVLARAVEDNPSIKVIGLMDPNSSLEIVASPAASEELTERRNNLPPLDTIRNVAQFEHLAKEVLGDEAREWHYFSSFADDGNSFRANRSSWSFLRFFPRVNVPVREVSTETTFLGSSTPVAFPIVICPTGQTASGHPDGELNHTRSSAVTGIPQIVSTMSSVSYPELAAERDRLEGTGAKRAPLWWQLYIYTDRKESERRMRQVAKAGCEAILITVDAPEIGNREADAKPPSSTLMEANLTWEDIAWVKRTIKDIAPNMPVLVKGIGCVADVELAKKHGADGVLLSNHGGRQLDFSPPPLATLVRLRLEQPALLEDPKFEVFVDGGVSRGTDVLKALCLGAKGVGLGRVFLYAQTCYGDAGTIRATEILQREVTSGMRLLGAKRIEDLKPEMIELLDGLLGKQM